MNSTCIPGCINGCTSMAYDRDKKHLLTFIIQSNRMNKLRRNSGLYFPFQRRGKSQISFLQAPFFEDPPCAENASEKGDCKTFISGPHQGRELDFEAGGSSQYCKIGGILLG